MNLNTRCSTSTHKCILILIHTVFLIIELLLLLLSLSLLMCKIYTYCNCIVLICTSHPIDSNFMLSFSLFLVCLVKPFISNTNSFHLTCSWCLQLLILSSVILNITNLANGCSSTLFESYPTQPYKFNTEFISLLS